MKTILEVTPSGDTLYTMEDSAFEIIQKSLEQQTRFGMKPSLPRALMMLSSIDPALWKDVKTERKERSVGGLRGKVDLDVQLNVP